MGEGPETLNAGCHTHSECQLGSIGDRALAVTNGAQRRLPINTQYSKLVLEG